jgi:hypothetical protein
MPGAPDSILPAMTDQTAPPDPPERLAPLFVAIVAVEALTIAALAWFGRQFS